MLYDSKHLTTHAVCVGMTGSGKTGLCLSLLEEAAIDGIPAIAIDPKGDLGNLLLTFPELRGEDFAPWVDPDEAAAEGAHPRAVRRPDGRDLAGGPGRLGAGRRADPAAARCRRLRDLHARSEAGLPLSVLRSFAAPPPALIDQAEAFRERVASSVSGLLALLGIEADPMSSREHILLANVLDHAWRAGRDLDLAGFIHAVQSPPFDKVGVIDLETFFPAKERFALAMKLNNLLASPGFAAWMEGEPLDVGSLLYTPEGKPRLSILSIAHLSDAERMFFVTLLLNEMLAWMRTQPGTSSLRALLYMDEIFGYFPPIGQPAVEDAAAHAAQAGARLRPGRRAGHAEPGRPRLQGAVERRHLVPRPAADRARQGARARRAGRGLDAAGQSFDRGKMDELLSSLGNRVFLMNNVHEDQPVVFQTRWALSYLRGPLTREQIQTLMAPRKQARAVPAAPRRRAPAPAAGTGGRPRRAAPPAAARPRPPRPRRCRRPGSRPVVPPDVPEFFIPRRDARTPAGALCSTAPRSWAWPGSITPTRSRASTTGRRSG